MLRLAEFTSNEGDALLLYLSIVTESTHPDHLRLAAEPGHLAFGVVAMGLLSCLQCGFPIDFPSQKLDCLFIAQRSQRARRIAVFLQEASGCRGIKSLQHAMQVRRSLFCGALAQALTQSFRTLRPGEEPFQQRAEI